MSARIAVIGAGKWGRNIIRTCRELSALRMVADISDETLAGIRREYPGIRTTLDVGEVMRSDVDAVAIATNASSHADVALRALRNGKDVFVEKPLALSVADAEAVAAAAERYGRKVFVGHLLLYHPAIVALRSAIGSGKIGSIVHLRSRRLSPGRIRTNESVWWSFAPHDVAVMIDILGLPLAVSASSLASVQPGIPDFTYADFAFGDNASAHIEVSWLDPHKSSRIDVFGTDGIVSVETARTIATLTYRRRTTEGPRDGTIPVAFGPAETIAYPDADPLKNELQSFVDWLGGGPTPPTDVRQGVLVVRTLAQADAEQRPFRQRVDAGECFATIP